MKATSEIALRQIKINKKRSIGTVLAIALSATIVTALMCFATSANHMLTGFLGDDYGDYSVAYTLMIVIPVGLLSLLIAFMSITCISNIFAASANKRIQEFGIVKCVGGTKKQIKEMVIFEGLWLSALGIPLGLLTGTLVGLIGVGITSHYVDIFNDLSKSIIMRPFEASLSFHISGGTYLFASLVSLAIVFGSAGKPAKAVGKLSAISCIKGLGANEVPKANERVTDGKNISRKTGRENENRKNADRKPATGLCSSLAEKIFGYEGTIGLINLTRNKAGYKASVRSLTLGLILFIMLGGLSSQAQGFTEWMTPDSKEMMVSYTSVIDYEMQPDGSEKESYRVPIYSDTYNEICDKLNEFDDNEVYGIGNDSITYRGFMDEKYIDDELLSVPGLVDDNGYRKISIVSADDAFYEKLCDRANAPIGSNLLINSFGYNDHGVMKTFKPYADNTDTVVIISDEGKQTDLHIGGILTKENIPETGFSEALPDSIRIVVPNAQARYFDWYSATCDEEGFNKFARKILDEYYPILTEDSYVEQGYTVRISRVDNMVKVLNMAFVLAEYVMYGFVILLMFIGFTSVISTMIINIRIRSREFAVLKSVGMTGKSLRKMVYCESLFCLLKAILPGIIFGLLIPWGVNLAIRQAFPILFRIPWGNIFFGIIFVTVVVMCITYVEMGREKDRNIIAEIRMDTM